MDISNLKFDAQGLIPAIAQDAYDGVVLMQAYMNQESIEKTLQTGYAHYYSRSRGTLWKKGETSGNLQQVLEMSLDCDGDCVLLFVRQSGPACHLGNKSCFVTTLHSFEPLPPNSSIVQMVYRLIQERRANPKEGSYTNYLLSKGIDKICKKVGEEAAEVIIAAKNNSAEEVRYEVADLVYHVSVLLAQQGLAPEDIYKELDKRYKP